MKKSIFILIIATTVFGLFIACEKVDEQITLHNTSLTFRTPGSPIVFDDRLTFSTTSDFNDYFDYLETLNDTIHDVDSLLNIEESRYAYNSLRSSLERDELSSSEFTDYYQAQFVHNIFMQSILNEFYEYGIADTVFVFLSGERKYKIIDLNSPLIDTFRLLPKGTGFVPVKYYGPDILMSFNGNAIKIASKSSEDGQISPRSWTYKFNTDYQTNPCNPRVKFLFLTGLRTNDQTGGEDLYSMDWTINFGDGSAVVVFNGYPKLELTKTYGGSGPYTISISARYYNVEFAEYQTLYQEITVNLMEICLGVYWQEYEEVPCVNGRKMVTRLWYDPGTASREEFGAYTHAWKYDTGNDKWKRDKCNLIAEFNADFYEDHCRDVEESIHEYQSCFHSKKAEVHRKKGGDFNWWTPGLPVSNHWLNADGHSYQNGHILDPCN